MLNVKKLLYRMLDKFRVKTETITATTSANGTVAIGDATAINPRAEVLSVSSSTSSAYMCIPWLYNNGTWYVKVLNWINMSAVANTQITLIVKYVGGYCVTSVFSRLSAIASHLKGWWHHVKSEETSVQTHTETDSENHCRLCDRDNNGRLSFICGYRHGLAEQCGHNQHGSSQHSEHRLGEGSAYAWWSELNNDSVQIPQRIQRSVNGQIQSACSVLSRITSSISERGWAVC